MGGLGAGEQPPQETLEESREGAPSGAKGSHLLTPGKSLLSGGRPSPRPSHQSPRHGGSGAAPVPGGQARVSP